MRTRDLGTLLFGFAGLYTLLVALLGAVQLLGYLHASTAMVGGRLQIQAAFVNATVSVLLHLVLGAALLAGRRRLALWLLAEEEDAPPAAGAALGAAAAGVCFLAILLITRVATALTYALSLVFLGGQRADLSGWTIGGILLDLLLAAAGLLLVARRNRIAARLLALPPAAPAAGDGAQPAWQLPGLRFVGLTIVVWYLPDAASALSALVRWRLQPAGFDLRSQAIDHLPPATIGIIAGLYLLLLFPAGLSSVWRRLREQPAASPDPGE